MLSGILVTVALVIAAIFSRSITTLIHEMGHAIPALMFTNAPVVVYVGSYGNIDDSLHLTLGRLQLYIKFNLFNWQIGLCTHQRVKNFFQQFLIIIGGPIASIIIAVFLFIFIYNYDFSDNLKLLSFIFLAAAGLDFISNISISSTPMQLHNGGVSFSDGYQLRQLFRTVRYPVEFQEGVANFEEGNYIDASDKFETVWSKGFQDEYIFQHLQASLIQANDNDRIFHYYQILSVQNKLSSHQYCELGVLFAQRERYDEALKAYNDAMSLDYYNKFALNNRGYLYNEIGSYDLAIEDFNQILSYDPNFAFALNNRGFALLKLGEVEAAQKDIEHSIRLDDQNAYAYRNLGLSFFEKKQYYLALEMMEKAQAMQPEDEILKENCEHFKNRIAFYEQ